MIGSSRTAAGLPRRFPPGVVNSGLSMPKSRFFLWAKAEGYKGEKLTRPTKVMGKLEIFSYLDGDVVHYKVSGEGHGATGAIDEECDRGSGAVG